MVINFQVEKGRKVKQGTITIPDTFSWKSEELHKEVSRKIRELHKGWRLVSYTKVK